MRVFHVWGIKKLLTTNASGGCKLEYKSGSLVIITDAINNKGTIPLIGPNDERFGPRFPDI
ncbi:MAG: purine-nucleoside phosphorylase, partial [Flavobacterium sp.]|nr:purine-nucleoside phosphorylase [Flavobacterium sp.]